MAPKSRKPEPEAAVRSLLFADVAGYSKLNNAELQLFTTSTLYEIKAAIGSPYARNTWGDGFFLVYKDPVACCDAALALRDLFRNQDWIARGYREPLHVRIAVSVAKVFLAHDPIREDRAVFGRQVSRTARLEPKCDLNEVFCLGSMYELLTDSTTLVVELLGSMELAKDWGAEPVYRLRRSYEPPAYLRPDVTSHEGGRPVPSELIGRTVRGYLGEGTIEAVNEDRETAVVRRAEDGGLTVMSLAKVGEWLVD